MSGDRRRPAPTLRRDAPADGPGGEERPRRPRRPRPAPGTAPGFDEPGSRSPREAVAEEEEGSRRIREAVAEEEARSRRPRAAVVEEEAPARRPRPESDEAAPPRRTVRRRRPPGAEDARPAFVGPIVPPQSVSGRALVAVVAIMTFLSCVMVGVMTLVQDAARDWRADVARELTVEVRPVEGASMAAQLADVRRAVEAAPGVGRARALSGEEIEALLAPWLGVDVPLEALPVPRLVAVTVADPAALDLEDLSRRVAAVEGASLDDHRMWTRRLSEMANAVTGAVLLFAGLILAALSLSVVFATRAAMSRNGETIAVLHLVGAEPGFIAREFQRHFLVLSLRGGAIGAGFAAAVFLGLGLLGAATEGTAAEAQARALLGTVSVGPAGYLAIPGVVLLVAVITALTARLAVHGHLRRLG